jgi:hypothetical protein
MSDVKLKKNQRLRSYAKNPKPNGANAVHTINKAYIRVAPV